MTRSELTKLFSKELFVPILHGKDKDEVLNELVDLYREAKLIKNSEIILEMLHKRESLGSTGIGKGVAIPHGRSTAVETVHIAFGKTDNGINYGAIDKKPVKFFFMVLAPPQEHTSKYLPALGKLVEVVSEAKNRKKMSKAKTYEEFIAVLEGGKE